MVISLICIFFTIKANLEMAEIYKTADGKTKAMFGLIEWGYAYKYFYIIPLLYSLVIAFYSTKKGTTKASLLAIGLALFSILLVFLRIWKWLI